MVTDGNVRVGQFGWRDCSPREQRPLWPRKWIAEAGELQLTGCEAKGLRNRNVGSAVYVDTELISMVTAPEGDRKTQLGGKGLSAWRGGGLPKWDGSERWQQGRGVARQPYPES